MEHEAWIGQAIILKGTRKIIYRNNIMLIGAQQNSADLNKQLVLLIYSFMYLFTFTSGKVMVDGKLQYFNNLRLKYQR